MHKFHLNITSFHIHVLKDAQLLYHRDMLPVRFVWERSNFVNPVKPALPVITSARVPTGRNYFTGILVLGENDLTANSSISNADGCDLASLRAVGDAPPHGSASVAWQSDCDAFGWALPVRVTRDGGDRRGRDEGTETRRCRRSVLTIIIIMYHIDWRVIMVFMTMIGSILCICLISDI